MEGAGEDKSSASLSICTSTIRAVSLSETSDTYSVQLHISCHQRWKEATDGSNTVSLNYRLFPCSPSLVPCRDWEAEEIRNQPGHLTKDVVHNAITKYFFSVMLSWIYCIINIRTKRQCKIITNIQVHTTVKSHPGDCQALPNLLMQNHQSSVKSHPGDSLILSSFTDI